MEKSNKNLGIPIPVAEGEVVKDVKIISTGKGGDGIAKVSGFVVFVPNTKPGDNVTVKILEVRNRYAKGEVVK